MHTLTRPKFIIQPEDDYPASDGMPMAETEVHILATVHLLNVLRAYFRGRDDVYVIGDMFVYYREGDPKARKAPDIMVAKGVDATIKRRTYKLWEEKVSPCFVVEITSGSTKREGIVTKPALYAQLGINEYFLFDPLHEYLDEQFIGYRMVNGEYTPIEPDPEGNLYSETLEILLGVNDSLLRIVTPDGAFFPEYEEAIEQAQQQTQIAEQESARRVAAEEQLTKLRSRLRELGIHEESL